MFEKKLWSERGRAELEKLFLAPWASRRRRELLELLDRMNPTIEELTASVEQEANKCPEALRLIRILALAHSRHSPMCSSSERQRGLLVQNKLAAIRV